jgi:hypothetical protein
MITQPEKMLFPDDGITKGELASYYDAVAPVMLPHLRARPITMERYPSGIGKPGFMHKDVAKGFPEWLERVEVPKKDGTVRHALVTDSRSLLWLANQNCITPHVWTSRVPTLYQPDLCVFDLDPWAGVSMSTPGATRIAPRWPRPTPSAPDPARRCPRHVPGKNSNVARWARGRSFYGRWPAASPTSVTYGQTCASARCDVRWSDCPTEPAIRRGRSCTASAVAATAARSPRRRS